MNERIQQLSEQATRWAFIQHCKTERQRKDIEKQKFAELIVKECIIAVETHGGMCGQTSSTKIKDHFGVKQ